MLVGLGAMKARAESDTLTQRLKVLFRTAASPLHRDVKAGSALLATGESDAASLVKAIFLRASLTHSTYQ